MRWEEEVQLLLEEMRRVNVYLNWEAGWWEERAERRSSQAGGVQVKPCLEEGLRAYARRQACLR